MPNTQIKNFCTVDIDVMGYLKQLKKEFTDPDMNHDPKIDPKEDQQTRETTSKKWLELRLSQLDSAETTTRRDLKKWASLLKKITKHQIEYGIGKVYGRLRTAAQNTYNETIRDELIDPRDRSEHQISPGGPPIK